MNTPTALTKLAPRRIVTVVFDIHADLEALIREAAWIVRERGGQAVSLSRKGYDLLRILALHPSKVISHQQLLE